MHELSLIAIDGIENNKIIVSINTTRAAMENTAVLNYISNMMHKSLEENNVNYIQEALKKWVYLPASCTHDDLKEVLATQHPDFIKNYDFLSEFVHPNSLGVTVFYSNINQMSPLIKMGYNELNEQAIGFKNVARDICSIALKETLEDFILDFGNIGNYINDLNALSQEITKKPLKEDLEKFCTSTFNVMLMDSQQKEDTINLILSLNKIT
jgi:hypothetical protein